MSTRLLRQGRLSSSSQSLTMQQDMLMQRIWDAILHFSSHHLYCPAHSSKTTTAAVAITTSNRQVGRGLSIRRSASDLVRTVRQETRLDHRSGFHSLSSGSRTSSLMSGHQISSSKGVSHLQTGYHSRLPRRTVDTTTMPMTTPTTTTMKSTLRNHSTSASCLFDQEEPPSSFADPPLRSESNASSIPSISLPMTRSRDEDSSAKAPAYTPPPLLPQPHTRTLTSKSKSQSRSESPPTSESMTTSSSTKHNASGWIFPVRGSHSPSVPPKTVLTWPSTNQARLEFNGAFHRVMMLSVKRRREDRSSHGGHGREDTVSSEKYTQALHAAIHGYNALSHIQNRYDVALVSRREVRNLFLLQAREPKTRENLDQLLKIALDLIWLHQKTSKRAMMTTTHGISSGGGGGGGGVSLLGGSEETINPVRAREDGRGESIGAGSETGGTAADQKMSMMEEMHDDYLKGGWKSMLDKAQERYNGLNLSEYTMLINWIAEASEKKARPRFMSSSQHDLMMQRSKGRRPVDRVWAMWKEFLKTGMEPDVVLYTALMDALLKTKEYDRAKAVWKHISRRQQSTTSSSQYDRKQVSEFSDANKNDSKIKSGHSINETTVSRTTVAPNLQTFSVLMQRHVLNRNLHGIAQTYKALVEAAVASSAGAKQTALADSSVPTAPSLLSLSSSPKSMSSSPTSSDETTDKPAPFTNVAHATVWNQILIALIEVGDLKGARTIFTDMQSPLTIAANPVDSPTDASQGRKQRMRQKGSEEDRSRMLSSAKTLAPSSPIHHQLFGRRSEWSKPNVLRRLGGKDKDLEMQVGASASESGQDPSLSPFAKPPPPPVNIIDVRPDATTYRLMLMVAREELDKAFEQEILRHLDYLDLEK
ncbi:hypothetical protein BGZ94_007563 [Podila epigama]|nr:hypothetical protein BGZ94_007563 [Podila epigama]